MESFHSLREFLNCKRRHSPWQNAAEKFLSKPNLSLQKAGLRAGSGLQNLLSWPALAPLTPVAYMQELSEFRTCCRGQPGVSFPTLSAIFDWQRTDCRSVHAGWPPKTPDRTAVQFSRRRLGLTCLGVALARNVAYGRSSGKRGFDKGSIIVSCDSFRRFWWPPVPGMSISYLSWEC
jgi:hypothetical protein